MPRTHNGNLQTPTLSHPLMHPQLHTHILALQPAIHHTFILCNFQCNSHKWLILGKIT